MIRLNKNESVDEWVTRVTANEMKNAAKRIKNGEDVDDVLNDYSEIFTKKIMHFIFIELKKAAIQPYDNEMSIKDYHDLYISRVKRPHDVPNE